jgi:hypothetical protein
MQASDVPAAIFTSCCGARAARLLKVRYFLSTKIEKFGFEPV